MFCFCAQLLGLESSVSALRFSGARIWWEAFISWIMLILELMALLSKTFLMSNFRSTSVYFSKILCLSLWTSSLYFKSFYFVWFKLYLFSPFFFKKVSSLLTLCAFTNILLELLEKVLPFWLFRKFFSYLSFLWSVMISDLMNTDGPNAYEVTVLALECDS